MKIAGRRIQIAGSADGDADPGKLEYAHRVIRRLVEELALAHATFALPLGGEPFLQGKSDGLSIIFDWTIAETIHSLMNAGKVGPSGPNGRTIATVSTTKSDSQIPALRRDLYDDLRSSAAIDLTVLDPGWTAGSLRRERLSLKGDILIALSGGQGVEQLATAYSTKGKPVIPLDLNLGSSCNDGSGGASRLFNRALASPADFIQVVDGSSAADLLDLTRTKDATVAEEKVVTAVVNLIQALLPPQVFYVRLLNNSVPEHASVEKFFRQTVDTLAEELGYRPLQMGIGKNEFAWMNQAIFDSIHHSSAVFVDLTTLRPNCFMELGYALGNGQRVIVSCREDTRISFDAFALEAFQWNESDDPLEQLKRLRVHWERNIEMPKLVKPREAK